MGSARQRRHAQDHPVRARGDVLAAATIVLAFTLLACASCGPDPDSGDDGQQQTEQTPAPDPTPDVRPPEDTQPAPADSADAPEAVAIRLAEALRAGDTEQAMSCWLDWERLLRVIKAIPAGAPAPGEEELAEMKQYWAERDKVVVALIPKLRAALQEHGVDVESLAHLETEAQLKRAASDGRPPMASMFNISLKDKNGAVVHLRVDDGIFVENRWYFNDELLTDVTLEIGGKEEFFTID